MTDYSVVDCVFIRHFTLPDIDFHYSANAGIGRHTGSGSFPEYWFLLKEGKKAFS